jgi:hypothetical protein
MAAAGIIIGLLGIAINVYYGELARRQSRKK